MKILFVASRFPYPTLYGDQVRAFHHIRHLSRRHEITLLAPRPVGDVRAGMRALAQFCKHIELLAPSPLKRLARLATFPVSRLPLQTLWCFDQTYAERANALIRTGKIDIVHVQMIRLGPLASHLPPDIPVVLDFIDALSVNMGQRATRRYPPYRWLMRAEAQRTLAYERLLLSEYEQAVISSPQDRHAIAEAGNLHAVANGVAVERDLQAVERERETVVFSGTMWYFPNVDASVWFAKEVWPAIRREVPGALINLVGARPAKAVRDLESVPGIQVTGFVPDLHAYLRRSTVAVAPMRSGSGMQFKVIEAMANRTPVVATSHALGGISVVAGQHLLVADTAEDFAAAVVGLLHDASARQRLSDAAFELVDQNYAWGKTVETLESVYQRAASRSEGHLIGGYVST